MRAKAIQWAVMGLLITVSLVVKGNSIFGKAKSDTLKVIKNAEPRKYHAYKIDGPAPLIDGQLTDDAWNQGCWSGGYTQQMPHEGASPSEKTEFKILYTESTLYVGIRAYEKDKKNIDLQPAGRDDFSGDIVGVCFDSYFDRRTGFEFDLTASGGKIDLLLMNQGADMNWNAVWEGKTAIEDSAWTAEMAIPFSQLRFGQKEVQIWGLHAWRWINRNQEEAQWSLIPRDAPARLENFGELHGISGIREMQRMELLPYTVSKIITTPKQEGNPYSDPANAQLTAGVDGKIALSSDFTLDFTFNPDFGQVEADPSNLNLTAYETYFEEKRPFFLEGQNILDFNTGGSDLYYSRRIGKRPSRSPDLEDGEFSHTPDNTTIINALKISGKNKRGLSAGILQSTTAEEKASVYSQGRELTETVEPLTNYLVARVQKDLNNANTIIGGIITSTNRRIDDSSLEFLTNNAYTGGLDLMQYFDEKTYYVQYVQAFSYVEGAPEALLRLQTSSARYYQRPDAKHFGVDSTLNYMQGNGGKIKIGKGGNGNWRYNTQLIWRSPGFETNDIGFGASADDIDQYNTLSYVVDKPGKVFRSYSLSLRQNNFFDYAGEYHSSSYSVGGWSKLANKWDVSFSVAEYSDGSNNRLLRGGPSVRTFGAYQYNVGINSDYSKKFNVYLYNFGSFSHSGQGYYKSISPGFGYKLSNSLNIGYGVFYTNSLNDYQYIDAPELEGNTRYILASLDQKTVGMTLRAMLGLTPDFSIQYYGSPYISTGNYNNFKAYVGHAGTIEGQFNQLAEGQVAYYAANNEYQLTLGGEPSQSVSLSNPDFNFLQFRSNLVARWEYKPGSTLYFVWTHSRSNWENTPSPELDNAMGKIFDIYPENAFLVKLNYWFSM